MKEESVITKELRDEVLRRVRTSPQYMRLSAAYQQFRTTGNWMQASIVCKKMKSIEDVAFEEIIKHYKHERVEMSDIISPMSKEDRATMNTYANCMMMISDVIHNMIMDMNSLVKKYNPDMKVISFNDLESLSNEAKKHVLAFDGTYKDDYVTNLFGTTADKLYEMIFNKAKSFVTKVGKHAEEINKNASRNAEVA